MLSLPFSCQQCGSNFRNSVESFSQSRQGFDAILLLKSHGCPIWATSPYLRLTRKRCTFSEGNLRLSYGFDTGRIRAVNVKLAQQRMKWTKWIKSVDFLGVELLRWRHSFRPRWCLARRHMCAMPACLPRHTWENLVCLFLLSNVLRWGHRDLWDIYLNNLVSRCLLPHQPHGAEHAAEESCGDEVTPFGPLSGTLSACDRFGLRIIFVRKSDSIIFLRS